MFAEAEADDREGFLFAGLAWVFWELGCEFDMVCVAADCFYESWFCFFDYEKWSMVAHAEWFEFVDIFDEIVRDLIRGKFAINI